MIIAITWLTIGIIISSVNLTLEAALGYLEKFIITKFDTFGGFLLYIAQLTMGLILSTIVWPVTLMNVIVMIKNLFNEK